MSKAKRIVPFALVSSEIALTDNTETAVTDANSVAISGCYISWIAIHTATTVAADAYLSILSAASAVLKVNLGTDANILTQSVFSFPFPIKISGALTLKQSGTCTATYRVGYIPF